MMSDEKGSYRFGSGWSGFSIRAGRRGRDGVRVFASESGVGHDV